MYAGGIRKTYSHNRWSTLDKATEICGGAVLRHIFHKNIPKYGKALYKKLNSTYLRKLRKLKSKGVLKGDQWDLLFPDNKDTDSSKFDITLLIVLIRTCTKVKAPNGGWNLENVTEGDDSEAANILRLQAIRNEMAHTKFKSNMTKSAFDDKKSKLKKVLDSLGYNALNGVPPFEELVKDCRENESRFGKILKGLGMVILLTAIILTIVILFMNLMIESAQIILASNRLEKFYQDAIGSKGILTVDGSRKERFYIDLDFMEKQKFDEKFNTEDRISYIINEINQRKDTLVNFDDIFDGDDKFVLLHGAGGMGKSFVSEQIALDWANREKWIRFRFVFLFSCKTLSNQQNIDSAENLLTKTFPQTFSVITPKLLSSITDEVLLIFDGIDEISDFQKTKRSKLLNSILDLVDPKNNFLHKKTVLVTGRPDAISNFHRLFSEYQTKHLVVTGFGVKSRVKFVFKYFENDNSGRDKVFDLITSQNVNMHLMAKVPVYLSMMCSLFQKHKDVDPPRTTTEMYVWQLAAYVKEHVRIRKDIKLKTSTLGEVFRISKVKNLIGKISQLAYEMLINKTAIVKVEPTSEKLYDEMEKTGLLMKKQSVDGENQYLFFHMTMQEFMASIHVCLNGNVKGKPLANMGILTFVAGLQGGLVSGSNSSFLIKRLARNVKFLKLDHHFLNGLSSEPKFYSEFFECYHEYRNDLESSPFFWNSYLSEPHENFYFGGYVGDGIKPEHFMYFLQQEPEKLQFLNRDSSVALTFTKKLDYNQSMLLLQNVYLFSETYLPFASFNDSAIEEFCRVLYRMKNKPPKIVLYRLPTNPDFNFTLWYPCISSIKLFRITGISYDSMKADVDFHESVNTICNLIIHDKSPLTLETIIIDYGSMDNFTELNMSSLQLLRRCLPHIKQLVFNGRRIRNDLIRANMSLFEGIEFTVREYEYLYTYNNVDIRYKFSTLSARKEPLITSFRYIRCLCSVYNIDKQRCNPTLGFNILGETIVFQEEDCMPVTRLAFDSFLSRHKQFILSTL